MIGRGKLFVEYAKDKHGNLRDEPFTHDLRTITVGENPHQTHGFTYEFDDGRVV